MAEPDPWEQRTRRNSEPPPTPTLDVVIPFIREEAEQVERLLRWIVELGQVDARCWLLCEDPFGLMPLAKQAFAEAHFLKDHENIKSDWKEGDRSIPRSAAGPNSLWKQAAWHFYVLATTKKQPVRAWLWLEPDAIPASRSWFNDIRSEYFAVRKPFMGALVRGNDQFGKPVADHMSGVGIYPFDVTGIMSTAIMSSHRPFDVAAPGESFRQTHWTKQIVHSFRPPPFASMEDLDSRAPRGTSVYHASKDGSIIPFLRQRITGVSVQVTPPELKEALIDEMRGQITEQTKKLENGNVKVVLTNGGPGSPEIPPRVVIETKAPETWIGGVRSLVSALEKLADTQNHKALIQGELKKVNLIPQKLRRR